MTPHFGGLAAGHFPLRTGAAYARRTGVLKQMRCHLYAKAEHFLCQLSNLPLRTVAAAVLEEIM